MERILNFWGGRFAEPCSGRYLPVFNPTDGKQYAEVALSTGRDLELALSAARQILPAWSASTREQRALVLRRIAEAIRDKQELFSQAESRDTGKPLSLARSVDIPRSIRNFEYFAEEVLAWDVQRFYSEQGGYNEVEHRPIGVVGCISPWNLPLYLLSWKIAPALAAGNVVMAKPSEITPMTAFLLSDIFREIGLPPGLISILHGKDDEIGSAIAEHPSIGAVSFTGSTQVGRSLANSAGLGKKLSLELGGKNATIVCSSADLEKSVAAAVRAGFANQGQICLCGSRIFVARSIYDSFRDLFVASVRALRVGDPADPDTSQGALVSLQHLQKVMQAVELAKAEGGRVLCGGYRVSHEGECAEGYFFAPTVIEGLSAEAQTNQCEIFGPVVTLQPFDSEDELVDAVNGTPYGLSASIWSAEMSEGRRIAARLQVGMAWINCWMVRDLRTPFGGVKDSGMGREGGQYALSFFSEAFTTCSTEALW